MKPGAGIHIKFVCLELGKEGCRFWEATEKEHCKWVEGNRNCRNQEACKFALKEDGYERTKN